MKPDEAGQRIKGYIRDIKRKVARVETITTRHFKNINAGISEPEYIFRDPAIRQ
jgi:hypothetical protein